MFGSSITTTKGDNGHSFEFSVHWRIQGGAVSPSWSKILSFSCSFRQAFFQTRMHSSKMRTAHLLTVSHYALPGGVPARGVPATGGAGVSAQGVPAWGCICWGVYLPRGCICLGGTCQEVYLPRGCTCWGCTYLGGVPAWGLYLPGGCTCLGGVPAQVLPL